jgi:hypothetical protein
MTTYPFYALYGEPRVVGDVGTDAVLERRCTYRAPGLTPRATQV